MESNGNGSGRCWEGEGEIEKGEWWGRSDPRRHQGSLFLKNPHPRRRGERGGAEVGGGENIGLMEKQKRRKKGVGG